MGLDVYLKHCKDLPAVMAKQEEYSNRSDAIWNEYVAYSDMTQEQKDDARRRSNAVAAELGLGEYGESPDITRVELPSEIDAEHMFKIGYFRSSYNGGGINRVMKKVGIQDLYEIMGVENSDHFNVHHDWAACRDRAEAAIQNYSAHLNSVLGKYDVTEVTNYHGSGARNEEHALELFEQEITNQRMFNSYSTRDGNFWLDGMKVLAVIPRQNNPMGSSVYVVYEKLPPELGKEDWYLTALRIVKETCEWVLRQEDPENYFMSWSG